MAVFWGALMGTATPYPMPKKGRCSMRAYCGPLLRLIAFWAIPNTWRLQPGPKIISWPTLSTRKRVAFFGVWMPKGVRATPKSKPTPSVLPFTD